MVKESERKDCKKSRGRMPDGAPPPVDVYVGKRLRLRRQLIHMSQETLACRLGVTFQQVQKYEKGENRLGASRLWDISHILGTRVDYFFLDMPKDIFYECPCTLAGFEEESCKQNAFPLEYRTDAQQLLLYYSRIQDKEHKKLVVDVAKGLSHRFFSSE